MLWCEEHGQGLQEISCLASSCVSLKLEIDKGPIIDKEASTADETATMAIPKKVPANFLISISLGFQLIFLISLKHARRCMMSDIPQKRNESDDPSDAPPSKRPCSIETPPVSTIDDGSDFYNTPLAAAGNPVPKPDGEPTGVVSEPQPTAQPAPVIPGLGLVNTPNEQSASNESAQQSGQDFLAREDAHRHSSQTEGTEETISRDSNADVTMEEPSGQAHDQHEATATSRDAMEVDKVSVQNGTQGAGEISATQSANEDENAEEHPEWEVDSSPYESSSDSSSDSDDSDEEDYPILSAEEQARILMLAEGGSDDEGEGKGKTGGFIRSAHEVDEDVLPIPDVEITPEKKIVLLGKIQAAIGNAVLIEASTSGEYQVLESGSLLCSEDRKVLGVVSETLGRVENPLYTVMYRNAAEVQERGLVKDMPVYYVEEHATFVFTQPLKGMKGSDASNLHDEEVAEDEIEFSDDEAEAEYRRKLKQKRQERRDARDGGASRGRRGPPGPSRLSHTELNYDDEGGEEGYTPLARPTNLHEMIGHHEAPTERGPRGVGFPAGRGRGSGRGSDRSRGGRGRVGGGRGGSWERDQDSTRQQQAGPSAYGQAAGAPHQSQAPYGQAQYPQQQTAYGMPNPFSGFPGYPLQQQPQFTPAAGTTQFPFPFPFQQALTPPTQFQGVAPHVNPLFLISAFQQQQQQQAQQPQQTQQAPVQGQQPNSAMNFDQVRAQLDLLRNLNNQNQGPPPS